MNAKDLMRIAGVESEEEFYSMYPTEEAFFEAFPDAAEYKKGGKIKKKFKPQDPATGYREFPPNVMQMGGGLINMMQGGGSIPNMPLAQDGMESTAQSGYISPYEESKFNVTGAKRKPVAKNSGTGVGDNVLAMFYGMGEGLLDTITMGMTDELTDKGFQALQNMNYDTERQKRNQNAARGFANAGAAIGGAFINPSGAGEAMSQITEGITTGASSLSGKPVEPSAPTADSQKASSAANSMMSKFMSMGSSMMGKYGGKLMQYGGDLKAEIGGPMESSMGLNELMGPTHEEGGMMISPQVEVEGGETILEPESYVYSDSIKVPGKNKTFAQESKSIKNKYKMRENDKLSQEAMTAELEALMNQQEEVREAMMIKDQERFENRMVAKYGGLMPSMDYSVDRNMQPIEMKKGGGIYIKPSKKGTFTAAAKKRGMGVQEFASKVMANKEDYSSAMVKKANFARVFGGRKREFGGFMEETDAINDPGKGGRMGLRRAQKIASNFQDSDIFTNPENYETIGVEGSQIYGRARTGTKDDVYLDFDNERQARRFLNTYESGKLDSFIENDFETPDKEKKSFDPNMLNIPTTAIAGVAAGLKGLGKQKPLLTPQAKVNYINTRPAEVLAERQAELAMAAGLAGLRDNATTQGNYLANVSNMAAQSGIGTGANIANIRFQGDTQNVGLANQGALQRQATIAANNALLRQARTAELLRRDNAIESLNRAAQTQSMDSSKMANQNLLVTLMAQDRVKYDNKGNLYIKTIDPNTKEEKWVRSNV
jgi:hypothetical protein